jgi:predicted RNA-binding Zn ribbon-like protein
MPRYDVPKAAPEPLRRVQLLVNSRDAHSEIEWLPEWLAEHDLGAGELARAVELREALRSLVLANNGFALEAGARAVFNRASERVSLRLEQDGDLRAHGSGDPLDGVVAVVLGAMIDGTWGRLKACRNCNWSFYDYSPNRSATWCSMQLCGNRAKTRAYRRRRHL